MQDKLKRSHISSSLSKIKPSAETTEDKLIYYRPIPAEADGPDAESNVIEMSFPAAPTIDEFKKICAAMALSLGYHKDIVIEIFKIELSESIKDLKVIKSHRK